jgi:eukaryotic-like serine/threonine-protein kinase
MSRINHIEIIDAIGSGGAAQVYRGVNLQNGKLVAVKMLWKNLFSNENLRRQFIEEANQYLYLNHPNIVNLQDFIIKPDAYYLVMEYIDGRTLEDYINRVSGPIPEVVAANMLKYVLEAIGYAHANEVLHLDIKPSNIMITIDGEVKVLDFGISRKSSASDIGGRMGSPYYMSPEQISVKDIGPHSDIYALGITFFQMLTASVPFPKNVTREVLFEKIIKDPLPMLKDFVPWASEAAEKIVARATQKNSKSRFSSCKEFSESLITLL